MDVTFERTALNQTRLIKDPKETLLQEVNILLFMKPGYDEDNPDKGVNISEFNYSTISTENKTKLEDRMRDNLQTYIGASFVNIIYDDSQAADKTIAITLEFMKEGQSFLFKVDPTTSANTLMSFK